MKISKSVLGLGLATALFVSGCAQRDPDINQVRKGRLDSGEEYFTLLHVRENEFGTPYLERIITFQGREIRTYGLNRPCHN